MLCRLMRNPRERGSAFSLLLPYGQPLIRVFPPPSWSLFPSLMEASPPHQLGSVHCCISFLHHLRCPKSATTAPFCSPPTLPQPPLPAPPPMTQVFFSKPNIQQSASSPPPPPYCFCPTTASVAAMVVRPPPEPPPFDKLQIRDRTSGSLQTLFLKQSPPGPPPLDLCRKRPPRKPPDVVSKSDLGCAAVDGASGCSFLFWMGRHISRRMIALMVFDERTQQRCAFWKNMMYAGPYVTDDNVCILSSFQSSTEEGPIVDKPETTCSRNVPAEAKKLIRNWIDKKTVDSHFSVVFDRGRKILIDWQMGSRYWLDHAPMALKHHMCTEAHVSAGLCLRGFSSLWKGNAPTLLLQSVCIDLCFSVE